jgi:hypothetical protein
VLPLYWKPFAAETKPPLKILSEPIDGSQCLLERT